MKFLMITAALGALFSSGALAQITQIQPIPMTGPAATNSPYLLDYQDAAFIQRRSDKLWFRYTKSNISVPDHPERPETGITVATSTHLRGNWTYAFDVLAGNKVTNPIVTNRSDTDLWAPEVRYYNQTYYLFYTTHNNAHSGNTTYLFDLNVATSPNMTQNSWTDHGSLGIPLSPKAPGSKPGEYTLYWVRLDGNLLANTSDPQGIDPKFQPFIAYGSFNWGLYGSYLTPDLRKMVTGDYPRQVIADQGTPAPFQGNKTEASFQINSGKYIYIFYSIGSCCAARSQANAPGVYRTYVCRTAVANGPRGQYVDKQGRKCSPDVNGSGTPFLENSQWSFAPGSVGIVNDPEEGGLVMTYQYYPQVGRDDMTWGFNYLEFNKTDDWPSLVVKRST